MIMYYRSFSRKIRLYLNIHRTNFSTSFCKLSLYVYKKIIYHLIFKARLYINVQIMYIIIMYRTILVYYVLISLIGQESLIVILMVTSNVVLVSLTKQNLYLPWKSIVSLFPPIRLFSL